MYLLKMFDINWDSAFLLKGCSQKPKAANPIRDLRSRGKPWPHWSVHTCLFSLELRSTGPRKHYNTRKEAGGERNDAK